MHREHGSRKHSNRGSQHSNTCSSSKAVSSKGSRNPEELQAVSIGTGSEMAERGYARVFGGASQQFAAQARCLSAPAIPEFCSTQDLTVAVADAMSYCVAVKAALARAVMTFVLPPDSILAPLGVDVYAFTGNVFNPVNPMNCWVNETMIWSDDTMGGAGWSEVLPITPINTPVRFNRVPPLNGLPGVYYRTYQIQVLYQVAGVGLEATDLDVVGAVMWY